MFLRFALASSLLLPSWFLAGCGSGSSKAPPAIAEKDPAVEIVLSPSKSRREEFVTGQGQRVQMNVEHDPWADAVVSFTSGKPAATRSTDPQACLGKPDYKGIDDAADEKTYLSLGYAGEVVLEFRDNVLIDGPGDDLVVFEIGPAVEATSLEISEDGKHWIPVGGVKGGKASVDIGPFVGPDRRFRFVKVIDARGPESKNSEWKGADIDAVGALNSLPVAP